MPHQTRKAIQQRASGYDAKSRHWIRTVGFYQYRHPYSFTVNKLMVPNPTEIVICEGPPSKLSFERFHEHIQS